MTNPDIERYAFAPHAPRWTLPRPWAHLTDGELKAMLEAAIGADYTDAAYVLAQEVSQRNAERSAA